MVKWGSFLILVHLTWNDPNIVHTLSGHIGKTVASCGGGAGFDFLPSYFNFFRAFTLRVALRGATL